MNINSESSMCERIPFQTEDGKTVLFYVLEQTKFYGVNYLLVTEDTESEDAEVYILKDLSGKDSDEAVYEMVEEDKELRALAGLFQELLEDVDLVEGSREDYIEQ